MPAVSVVIPLCNEEDNIAPLQHELTAAITTLAPPRQFLIALEAAAPQLGIDENFTEAMGYNPFLGRTALYITDRAEGKPASTLMREFAHWKLISRIEITRRGLPLRQLRVFACTDFRQLEL